MCGCVTAASDLSRCKTALQFSPPDTSSEVCDPGVVCVLPAGEISPTVGIWEGRASRCPRGVVLSLPRKRLEEPAKNWSVNLPPSEERKLSKWAREELSFGNPGDNRSRSFTQWFLHNNLWSGWSVYFRKASKWWEVMQHFCYLFPWLVTLTVPSVFLIARFSFFHLQFLAAGFWCVFARFRGSKYLCMFGKNPSWMGVNVLLKWQQLCYGRPFGFIRLFNPPVDC